jgi:hypothetical protein
MSCVRRGWAVWMLVFAIQGCSGGQGEGNEPASRREQDSIIGASKLPGAQGVSAATRAADSAAARRAREDSASAGAP